MDEEFVLDVTPDGEGVQETSETPKSRCGTSWTCRDVAFIVTVLLANHAAHAFLYLTVNTYGPQLVSDFHVVSSKSAIGYFSGAIPFAFFIGEMCSNLIWPRVSDYVGRRPVILINLACNCVVALSMCFSHNFPYFVIFRFLDGLFTAPFPLTSIAFGENRRLTSEQRSFAASLIMAVWAAATVYCPLVGGYLARPTVQYHEWFSSSSSSFLGLLKGFFDKFPFFLPNFCGVVLMALSLVGVWFGAYETNPKVLAALGKEVIIPSNEEEKEKEEGENDDVDDDAEMLLLPYERRDLFDLCADFDEENEESEHDEQIPKKRLGDRIKHCLTSQICTVPPIAMLLSYLVSCVIGVSLSASIPVLFTFNLSDRGFQLSVAQIGLMGLSEGLFSGLAGVVFAVLGQYLNPVWVLRIVPLILIPFAATYPELYYLRAWNSTTGQVLFWTVLLFYTLVRAFVMQFVYTVIFVLLNNSIVHELKSQFFSLVFCLGSLGKAFGPLLGGLLLSAGVSVGVFPFDIHFGFFLSIVPIAVVSGLGFLVPVSLKIQFEEGEGGEEKGEEEEEEQKKKVMIVSERNGEDLLVMVDEMKWVDQEKGEDPTHRGDDLIAFVEQ